jgi:hypothetical protein
MRDLICQGCAAPEGLGLYRSERHAINSCEGEEVKNAEFDLTAVMSKNDLLRENFYFN